MTEKKIERLMLGRCVVRLKCGWNLLRLCTIVGFHIGNTKLQPQICFNILHQNSKLSLPTCYLHIKIVHLLFKHLYFDIGIFCYKYFTSRITISLTV
jgi:hypothetical protein